MATTKHAAGAAEDEMHNIEGAFYAGGPGEPYFQPGIACSCGWSERAETWEDVGREYDAHLKAAAPTETEPPQ